MMDVPPSGCRLRPAQPHPGPSLVGRGTPGRVPGRVDCRHVSPGWQGSLPAPTLGAAHRSEEDARTGRLAGPSRAADRTRSRMSSHRYVKVARAETCTKLMNRTNNQVTRSGVAAATRLGGTNTEMNRATTR